MESLKPGIGALVMFVFGLLVPGEAWSAVSKITSIDFIGTQSPNLIEIRSDGPLSFEKLVNEADKQVVIELKDATLTRMASRKIDTSSFNSKVLLISPYQVEGMPDTVRIVVQLREPGDVEVGTSPSGLAVSISGPTGSEDQAPVANTSTAGDRSPLQKKMDQFLTNIETQSFTGRSITLQARDMDIGDVFRLISETSGFNIILASEVQGKISLSLVDVPWDQALDVVLKTQGLAGERSGNILRILSVTHLTEERIRDAKAKFVQVAAIPRITRIFPISYANLEDLQTIIGQLLGLSSSASAAPSAPNVLGGAATAAANVAAASGDDGAGGSAPGTQVRTIAIDKRTNSLIVKEIPESMEKIAKLILLLDTQTPQVIIEGKIVEASEQFSKTMSGSLGTLAQPNSTLLSFNGGNPIDPLIGGVVASGSEFARGSVAGGQVAMSFVNGVKRLNALISMGETESTLKVVSSPRAVVSNKQKANIVQTTPVALTTTVFQNGIPVVGTQVLNAELSLDVTPTVTNDGSVRLEISLKRDVPQDAGGGQTAVASRNIKTDVVVDSGSTLVLGGFYTVTNSSSSNGFPFLRKLPILGTFFGAESDSTQRSELFFFITPQIIEPKRAGLGT